MKFTQYVNNEILCESLLASVEEPTELETLVEEVALIEDTLNEFLGLGKLADKLTDRAKGKAKDAREKQKEETKSYFEKQKEERARIRAKEEKGKALAGKIADVSGKIDKKVSEIGDRATAAKDAVIAKKDELKASFGKVLKGAKDVFTKFGEESMAKLTPKQKELATELAPLFNKMKRGRSITGEQSLMVIAAVLAGIANADGGFPSKADYDKQLTRLRTLPGMHSFAFSVKYNGDVEE